MLGVISKTKKAENKRNNSRLHFLYFISYVSIRIEMYSGGLSIYWCAELISSFHSLLLCFK